MNKVWLMPILLVGLLGASCSSTIKTVESDTQTQTTGEQSKAVVENSLTPESVEAFPAPFYAENNIAIKGADPVAYFTEGRYIPGSEQFTHDWNGVTWQFTSAAHRDLFASAPAKYAPQYGGFCAWAVSEGYIAPTDPAAWKIVDGKLYLNYDKEVQADWETDIPGNIGKANVNWPQLTK